MANKFNREDYPNLFGEVIMANGAVKGQFEVFQTTLKPKLVSNVNLVAYIGDRWVVIRLSNQEWEIPGGTVEPGEHYLETLARKLMEEAGAELVSHRPLGA